MDEDKRLQSICIHACWFEDTISYGEPFERENLVEFHDQGCVRGRVSGLMSIRGRLNSGEIFETVMFELMSRNAVPCMLYSAILL